MTFQPTRLMGRPRTLGTWKALPGGQARTAPWRASQTTPRPVRMSANNWHSMNAAQQILRGLVTRPAAARIPVLGIFGTASAAAACLTMLLGGGCAEQVISLRIGCTENPRARFLLRGDRLHLRALSDCTRNPLPSEAEVRRQIAQGDKVKCTLKSYTVRSCPGGRQLVIGGSCQVPPHARPALMKLLRRFQHATRPPMK
jgi:hypothetical protein